MAPGLEKHMQGYIERRTFGAHTQGQTHTCASVTDVDTQIKSRGGGSGERRGVDAATRRTVSATGCIPMLNFPQLSLSVRATRLPRGGESGRMCMTCSLERVRGSLLHIEDKALAAGRRTRGRRSARNGGADATVPQPEST